MASACPVCGFSASSVSPSDTAAALRSFPRRYKAVLIRPTNDEADDPIARRGSTGWSALDHATWAANTIDAVGQELYQVLVRDNAEVNPPPIDPDRPPADGISPEEALIRLTTATTNVAKEIDGAQGDQWARTGVTPSGERITALDLARHAVHEGIHHLRLAEKVLQEVVGHPTPPQP